MRERVMIAEFFGYEGVQAAEEGEAGAGLLIEDEDTGRVAVGVCRARSRCACRLRRLL